MVIITVLFAVYLYFHHHQLLDSFAHIKFRFLLLVLLGQILGQFANSGVLRSSLRPLNVRLGFFESFRVTVVSSFVNFFAPLIGGASTRAVYLKKRHGLAYSSLLSTLYANYGVMFFVSFTFGVIGVLATPHSMSDVGLVAILFFAAGLIGSLAFIMVGHKFVRLIRRLKIKNRALKSLINKILIVDEGWGLIRKDRQAMIEMCLWSTIANLCLLMIYWAATSSVGITTNFGTFMIYAAMASVSLLLNLTPGNVGIRESLYASIYKITGVGLQKVIAFSLIDRAGQLIIIGLGWLLFGQSIVKNVTPRKDPSD